MARNPSLSDLLTKFISATKVVDDHVLRSDHIRNEILRIEEDDSGYAYSFPEDHLEDDTWDLTGLWEKYFEHLLKVWDEDIDRGILSGAKVNFIVDRLTAAASKLDHYGPPLAEAYRRIPSVPEARLQGIDRRRTVLNGFLNSAEMVLEQWYRRAGLLKERSLRQRRKIPDTKETEIEEELELITKEQSTRPARTPPGSLSRVVRAIVSNSTLIALTFTITVAAAVVQAYSYRLATGTEQRGTWDSAECLSTIQSCLMQLLGLYVTVLPALRHRHICRSYTRWSLVLAVLGIVSAALSMACFVYSPAISQLTLFFGSAIQAAIVMQLVWAVDEVVGLEPIDGKSD